MYLKSEKGVFIVSLNPKRLIGNWYDGWSLDLHSISSKIIGENEFGHPVFETTRTDLGQQVFLLKNRGRKESADLILDQIKDFLDNWAVLENVDCILPTPPSNKNRIYQPVFEIAKRIAEYTNKKYAEDVLVKNSTVQSKNMSLSEKIELKGSVTAQKFAKRRLNVLLVDDLYDTGSTIIESVDVLRNDPNVDKIYILVMTRTRRW